MSDLVDIDMQELEVKAETAKKFVEELKQAISDIGGSFEEYAEALNELAQAVEELTVHKVVFDAIIENIEKTIDLSEFIYPAKQMRRTYPPYRERLHGRTGWQRKTFWNRVRSNPKRKRKPH